MVEVRGVVALLIATGVGAWGLHTRPFPADDPFLDLIAMQDPFVFHVLAYGYAALWFTTPFWAASLLTSIAAIVVSRSPAGAHARPLPAYPDPATRPTPMLVLGEAHFARVVGPAPQPAWLTIPERGLYTGVMILGAVGTGKTSACMYPYVDQLVRWRADDSALKVGGLVLEVKGDFCQQVRQMLARAGRDADYLELGLDTGVCYNPLHNDLDPYAVAYAIGSLLNNLFGKSKEPFWQQAYTDLLKFVISLRRITNGYTTLAEVYQHIIQDELIRENLKALKKQFENPPDVLAVPQEWFYGSLRLAPWTLWSTLDAGHVAHPFDTTRFNGGSPTRGPTWIRRSRPPSSRASSCSFPCSTRIPPFTARSVRRATRTSSRRNQASRARCRRSRTCSRRVTYWVSTSRWP
jgi:hypothetical protein